MTSRRSGLARGTRHRCRSPEHPREGRARRKTRHIPKFTETRPHHERGHRPDTGDHPAAPGKATGRRRGRRPGGPPARARSGARSASTPAAGPCTPPTARTTARCPSASSSPGTPRTSRRPCRLPPVRGADPRPRRRHQPRRPVLQRRRRAGLLQVHEPASCEIDPHGGSARCPAGVRCSTGLRQKAEEHGLTFGPDPATHNALHPRRHARQQLVRHPLADGRAGPPTTSTSWRSSPTTARGCASARPTTPSSSGSSPPAAAGPRSTRPLRDLRDRYADQIRTGSRSCRAASRATTSTSCCRRTASTSPAPWSARRARCVTILEATLPAGAQPAGAVAAGARLPDVAIAGDHVPEILEHRPIGLEGIDDRLLEDMKQKGTHHVNLINLLPPGKRLAAGRVRRRDQAGADDQARRLHGRACGDDGDLVDVEALPDKKEEQLSGRSRGRPRRHACVPASPTPGPAGRIPPCRPSRSAPTCATSASCSRSTATSARCTATSARAASTTRIDFDLYTRRGRGAVPPLHGRGRRPRGQLRRLALRRTRRRPGARRAAAEDVRREALPGVPRVQGDLGPGRQDEPGQDGRRLSDRRQPAPRAATTTRRRPRRISSSPTTTAASRTRPLRCVGVGKCRRTDAGTDVPELHGDAARRSTRRAAGPACCSRCSRARC